MKKFFSFVLVAMMAIPTFADKTVEFGAADFAGKGTESSGSEVSVTKDGVTFLCDKGYGDGKYGVRCYKGSTVTISATENIKQIDFEFGLSKDGGLLSSYGVGDVTWTTGVLQSQARFNKIVVTLGEGAGEGEKLDVITPEQAIEIGMALADSTLTEKQYIVTGYVTFAKAFDTKYNNQSFYMASDADKDSKDNFQAYRTIVPEPVQVGDYVTVQGKIMKYPYKDETTGEVTGYSIQISGGKCEFATPSAVENVKAEAPKAKKMVDENGQLVIIRGNVRYNAVGAVIE